MKKDVPDFLSIILGDKSLSLDRVEVHVFHIVTGGKPLHLMETGTFAILSVIPLALIYRSSRRTMKET
ncbi:MAG: hypothetical protein IH932_04840 [Thaumarchaeota archaeon]|nr:hypothetical protein [Nitrososphaerota archaeon]